MKKILIILGFIVFSANYALSATSAGYCDYLKTLNLSKKQTLKIEEIEKKYRAKITLLNADVILKNMEIAQLKPYKNATLRISAINAELDEVMDELSEIEEQKQDEIMSCLGPIQKFKYRKYCKKADRG